MQKRWFNFRPIFLTFVFLMIGILFAFYITKYKVVSLIAIFFIFAIVVTIAVIKRKIVYLLIPVFAFIFACSIFNISVNSFNNNANINPTNIYCRVYSISSVDNGIIRVKADNCKFDGKGYKTNINILIYDDESNFKNVEIGSVISFKPIKFYKSDLEYNSSIPNSKMFSDNLKYTATCNIDNLMVQKIDKTFVEKIKQNIKDNLSGNLSNENVEIAYSALFGDKELLSEEQYSAYRLSGIAHLLAVSGLHVTIIVAIISKILSLMKVKGWANLIVISIFLLLYAYVCNFSVSVVRASVMSIILLLSVLLGREYDSLTSIGFAGIIIFCMNPLCVFDISFLMSFSCVLGIVLFSKPFSMVLQKAKMPNKVADAFAISASTLLTLMVISAFYFNNFNVISLIANVIIIPIFTIVFSVVFVVSLMSLIIPFITVVLSPLNYVFDFINVMASFLGNLNFANFSTAEVNFIGVPIYFVLLLIISRICVAKHINKLLISMPILAIMVLCLL